MQPPYENNIPRCLRRGVDFQKKFIQIFPEYGGKKIYVDDVFCIKNIDLSKVNFTKRLKRGIYRITIPGAKTIMEFNLLVPSMYE